jgi:hypothetical protein
VTIESHVEALKEAGGTQFTTSYWFPDGAFDNGNVGLFSTLEVVETIEVSLASTTARRATSRPPGDLIARGFGTPVSHRFPA